MLLTRGVDNERLKNEATGRLSAFNKRTAVAYSQLGTMNHPGHPLWFFLFVIALFPIGALAEVVGAVFSTRVRAYIVRHPIAHLLWFVLALLLSSLLFPAYSTRHGGF
jgi:hypothetical protein